MNSILFLVHCCPCALVFVWLWAVVAVFRQFSWRATSPSPGLPKENRSMARKCADVQDVAAHNCTNVRMHKFGSFSLFLSVVCPLTCALCFFLGLASTSSPFPSMSADSFFPDWLSGAFRAALEEGSLVPCRQHPPPLPLAASHLSLPLPFLPASFRVRASNRSHLVYWHWHPRLLYLFTSVFTSVAFTLWCSVSLAPPKHAFI